jgi:hypothetical protein
LKARKRNLLGVARIARGIAIGNGVDRARLIGQKSVPGGIAIAAQDARTMHRGITGIRASDGRKWKPNRSP